MSQFNYHCPNCQHEYLVGVGVYTCPKCGQANNVTSENSKLTSGRYSLLKTLSSWFKVLAVMSFLWGVLILLGAMFLFVTTTSFYDPKLGVILIFCSFWSGAVNVVILLSISEVITLFVSMANDLSEVKMSLDDQ